ncbi:MAG: hypothetical protein IJX63_03545 [Lachnospiraceae bacterium]|nr:hypothetical protein [Lachnospiraceae bacterium]
MTNKEKYQQAFSTLKASRKLEMEDIEMSKDVIFTKAVAVAAAIALCFVGSNGICYAATGATWVEKMIVHFNGEPVEMDVEVKDMGDGTYGYFMELPEDGEYTVDVPENSSIGVAVITEEVPEDFQNSVSDIDFALDLESDEVVVTEGELLEIATSIEVVDGIQWLCVNEERVDITEDFADGEASVLIPLEGEEYYFYITGTAKEYSIILGAGTVSGVPAE